MDLVLIVSIVIFIVVFSLFYMHNKSIMKSIFLTSTIVTLISAALSVWLYLDIMDLKENLPFGRKTFLLEDQGTYLSGISATEMDMESMEYLSSETLAEYEQMPLDEIGKESYKTFILKMESLQESTPEDMEIEGLEMEKKELIHALRSENPSELLLDSMTPDDIKPQVADFMREQIRGEMGEEHEIKGKLFMAIFAYMVQERGPSSIIEEYKKGGITIYPETVVFKVIRHIPSSFIGGVSRMVEERIDGPSQSMGMEEAQILGKMKEACKRGSLEELGDQTEKLEFVYMEKEKTEELEYIYDLQESIEKKEGIEDSLYALAGIYELEIGGCSAWE